MGVNPAAAISGIRRKKQKIDPEAGDEERATPRAVVATEKPSRFQYIADAMKQEQVKAAYRNSTVQVLIAVLIMGNFVTNIVEKQIDPWNIHYPDDWKVVEAIWNIIFIFELGWNMYGSWYLSTLKNHFLCSGWNLFDLLVVSISVPTLIGVPLSAGFGQLRMLRAFRVFRLFKRVPSLNKILTSLGRAVPGLRDAAIVQLIVMCIYAILAVDLFGDFGTELQFTNIENNTVALVTARGMSYGEEYYGNFFKSLYTLFQVLTGESWSEAVARPVLFTEGLGTNIVAGLFYISYIIICGIVLVNVAVAVLLEKMVDVDEQPEEPEGISLDELPASAQMLLKPLDIDGDGVITKDELMHAADLVQKERAAILLGQKPEQGQEQADERASTAGAALQDLSSVSQATLSSVAQAARGAVEVQMEATLKILREETMERENRLLEQLREETTAREARLLDALNSAAEREMMLQDSLQAIGQTMSTISAHATRPRRAKPASASNVRSSTPLPVDNGTPPPMANGGRPEEDKLQDGERAATKQAPERMQRL